MYITTSMIVMTKILLNYNRKEIMNKFKVGDEVRLVCGARNIANNLGDGNIYIVEGIKLDGIKLKGLFPYYHSSLFEIVEILKERNMSKFKVGDKVVRVSETYGKAIKGGVYEVSGVSDKGCLGNYGINLKGHEGVSGKFNYESSCFELYVDGVLSPLEAADAILHKEPLQEFCEHTGKWFDFACSLKGITLDMLQNTKFRRKPKTVIINGVEVTAPIDTVALGYPDKVWGFNLTFNSVYSTTGHTKRGLFWATEEGAQKALDAMLIPFKESDNE